MDKKKNIFDMNGYQIEFSEFVRSLNLKDLRSLYFRIYVEAVGSL